jgi:hypothetical protein
MRIDIAGIYGVDLASPLFVPVIIARAGGISRGARTLKKGC